MEPKFAPLIKFKRNGLSEQEHTGLIVLLNKEKIIKKVGEDNNYPFFQRSCMKPLQLAKLIDSQVDKVFKFSIEEIAVSSASHTGSSEHIKVVKSLLSKIGLDASYLKCGASKPISLEEQKRLILANEHYSVLHNNCSGKHAAMLAFCLTMGWDLHNYLDDSHPLNKAIVDKVKELCEVTDKEVIFSKDGCGLPTIATTLYEMGKGFLNLFLDDKYKTIKDAFLNYPYLIGGHLRLDSEIMNSSGGNLVAKVGAGGLCTIVNLNKQECLVVKIADVDMKARSLVVIDSLKQLGWLEEMQIINTELNGLFDKTISTIAGEIIGSVEICYSLAE